MHTLTATHEAKIEKMAAKDAAEFAADNGRKAAVEAAADGQMMPDEAWLNAIGVEAVAKALGVKAYDKQGAMTDDMEHALGVYNRAWRDAAKFESEGK